MAGNEVSTGKPRSTVRGLLTCCAALVGITVGVGIGRAAPPSWPHRGRCC